MVYERRPQRSSYSDSSRSSSLFEKETSSDNYIRSTPISQEEHQRWLRQLEEERELRYFNSLPVFEIEDVGETITPKNLQAALSKEKKEKKNSQRAIANSQTHSTTSESKKSKLTKEEEEEEEKKKKKKNSWFPWLNRRSNEDKPKADSKGNKPNRANNTTNGQTTEGKTSQRKTTASDKSQTDKTTIASTGATPSLEQSNKSRTKSNTTPTQTQPKTESPAIANTPAIAAPTNQPIFVSPDLSTARTLNSETILGKTGNGEILYTSSNPSATKTTAAENGLAVSQLPASSSNALFAQQQASAQGAIAQVRSSATQSGANVTQHSENSLSRLDGEIARINSAISNQITQQQRLIADITQSNRTTVITTTEATIASMQNKHATTIAAIENRAGAANERLTAQYQSILPRIDGAVTEFDGRIGQTLTQTEGFFAQQHQRWLITIDNTERGYSKSFSKQSPPSSSNVVGLALEKIDRQAYVSNWREAKVKATRQVANSFRESTNSSFAQHTAKLSGYRSTVMDGMRTLAQKRKQELTAQYLQAQTQINHTASTARAIANASLNQSIASARLQQQQQLATLDAVAARQNTIVAEQGATSATTITQLGNTLRGNLQTATATAVSNFNRSAEAFANGLSFGNDASSLAQAPAAATAAQNQIEVLEYQTINEIEYSVTGSIAQLQQQHSDIDSGLAQIASSVRMQQADSANQYQNSLQQLTNSVSKGFDQQLQHSNNDINKTVSNTNASWEYFANNLWDQFLGVNRNLKNKLTEAQNQILAQKENFILNLGEQIRTNAEREASGVQPAWKKIAKIAVNIVITVAVTVAIAALAVSGVGLVAGIGLAALLGASAGVTKLAISDAIDGKRSSGEDYLKAAGIGAATGVLEFAGASAIASVGGKLTSGVLTKLEHTLASTAVEAVTNTTTELIEGMASGQDFTLALLGISLLSSLLSTAGGKYIDGAFGDIAKGAGREASEDVTETVVEGIGSEVVEKGFKLNAAQFATETAFDTAVETGASVARGEEVTWGSLGENVASGVMGRGVAGRADKLYGERLRGIGNSGNSSTSNRRITSRSNNNVEARGNSSTGANRTGRANPPSNTNSSSIDLNKQNQNNNNAVTSQPTNRTSPLNNDSTSTPTTNLKRNPELEAYASSSASNPVEVYSDPDLSGRSVKIDYERAEDGTITGVRMRAGEGATPRDIELHQHSAKVMQMYGGTLGKIRVVEAKIASWLGIKGQPKPGTKAWEAQHEVYKIGNQIIPERLESLQNADPDTARELEAEIDYLNQQLEQHSRTFEAMDESEGVGYIAGLSPEKKQESIDKLKQEFGEGDFTKEEIIEKLGWNEDSSKTVSNKISDLKGIEEEGKTLYYNRDTQKYSYNPNNPQITYKKHRERFEQVKERLRNGGLKQTEIAKYFSDQGIAKYSRRQMEVLTQKWLDDESIGIQKVDGTYVLASDKEAINAHEIKEQAKQKKQTDAQKTRDANPEYQSLKQEFIDDLNSGRLDKKTFNEIYEWRETIRDWNKIDPSFDLNQMIRDAAGKNHSAATSEFRNNLRQQVAEIILESPPEQRIRKFNQFTKALRRVDQGTKGNLFTLVREKYLARLPENHPNADIKPYGKDELSTNIDSGESKAVNSSAVEAGLPKPPENKHYIDKGEKISDPKERYQSVQTQRQVDGFVKIEDSDIPGSPDAGNYLVEDKAGRSFNLEQAQEYSAHIMRGEDKGKISTRESGEGKRNKSAGNYDGVVYFFEDKGRARFASRKLEDLEAYQEGYMHVAFFNDEGKIEWYQE